MDLWVVGPPCGLKVGRVVTSCTAASGRHVSEQLVNYAGNKVGTKDGEQREQFSCLLNEANQLAKFSSIGGYRNVIHNSNKALQTEWYNKVFT